MELLISKVQKKSVLWNKSNYSYKDRLIVDKEWDTVSKAVGLSKYEAKKKWRNLRDQFFKELKRIPKNKLAQSQDYAKAYPGKWQYFTSLLFLHDKVSPKDTDGNLSQASDLEESDNEESNTELFVPQISLIETPSVSAIQSTTIPYPSSDDTAPPPRKRMTCKERSDVELRLRNIEAKKLALVEASEDENYFFLRSLVPFMRNLDPIRQLRVRTKFQDILLQEMEEIQKNQNEQTQ